MRRVPVQALTDDDLSAWSALAGRAAEPNPFFEPDFVLAAAESPNAEPPELLVEERDGEWIACAPVRVTRLLGRPLALSTWNHAYAHVGTPLVDDGHLSQFADALAARLTSGHQARFLMLRQAVDVTVVQAIRAAVERSPRLSILFEHSTERAAVHRRADGVDAPVALKPRRRRELEKRRRKLAEKLGAEPVVIDRSDNAAAVEEFLRLEASGWKGVEGTAMQTAGDADVFRTICDRFGEEGRLQILSLEADEIPLAMQCNIRGDDTLFNFKVAFDERFRTYAPGIQLELDTMRIFQAEREEEVLDSCADPDNELLNRLWPDRRPVITLVVGPSGAAGRAVGRALGTAHRVVRKRPPGNRSASSA
jgi:CelD/BcsL family acetyltransferase involved in cellulose biosynthesis